MSMVYGPGPGIRSPELNGRSYEHEHLRHNELLLLLEEKQAEIDILVEQRRDKDAAISFLKNKILTLQNRAGIHGQSGVIDEEVQNFVVHKERRIEDLERDLRNAVDELHKSQEYIRHLLSEGPVNLLYTELQEQARELAELRGDAVKNGDLQSSQALQDREEHRRMKADFEEQRAIHEHRIEELGASREELRRENDQLRLFVERIGKHVPGAAVVENGKLCDLLRRGELSSLVLDLEKDLDHLEKDLEKTFEAPPEDVLSVCDATNGTVHTRTEARADARDEAELLAESEILDKASPPPAQRYFSYRAGSVEKSPEIQGEMNESPILASIATDQSGTEPSVISPDPSLLPDAEDRDSPEWAARSGDPPACGESWTAGFKMPSATRQVSAGVDSSTATPAESWSRAASSVGIGDQVQASNYSPGSSEAYERERGLSERSDCVARLEEEILEQLAGHRADLARASPREGGTSNAFDFSSTTAVPLMMTAMTDSRVRRVPEAAAGDANSASTSPVVMNALTTSATVVHAVATHAAVAEATAAVAAVSSMVNAESWRGRDGHEVVTRTVSKDADKGSPRWPFPRPAWPGLSSVKSAQRDDSSRSDAADTSNISADTSAQREDSIEESRVASASATPVGTGLVVKSENTETVQAERVQQERQTQQETLNIAGQQQATSASGDQADQDRRHQHTGGALVTVSVFEDDLSPALREAKRQQMGRKMEKRRQSMTMRKRSLERNTAARNSEDTDARADTARNDYARADGGTAHRGDSVPRGDTARSVDSSNAWEAPARVRTTGDTARNASTEHSANHPALVRTTASEPRPMHPAVAAAQRLRSGRSLGEATTSTVQLPTGQSSETPVVSSSALEHAHSHSVGAERRPSGGWSPSRKNWDHEDVRVGSPRFNSHGSGHVQPRSATNGSSAAPSTGHPSPRQNSGAGPWSPGNRNALLLPGTPSRQQPGAPPPQTHYSAVSSQKPGSPTGRELSDNSRAVPASARDQSARDDRMNSSRTNVEAEASGHITQSKGKAATLHTKFANLRDEMKRKQRRSAAGDTGSARDLKGESLDQSASGSILRESSMEEPNSARGMHLESVGLLDAGGSSPASGHDWYPESYVASQETSVLSEDTLPDSARRRQVLSARGPGGTSARVSTAQLDMLQSAARAVGDKGRRRSSSVQPPNEMDAQGVAGQLSARSGDGSEAGCGISAGAKSPGADCSIEQDSLHRSVMAFCSQRPATRYPLMRLSRGVYLYGNKKLVVSLRNDKLMVRIGGGFINLESFLASDATGSAPGRRENAVGRYGSHG